MNLIIDIGNSAVKYYYAGLDYKNLNELPLESQSLKLILISTVPSLNQDYLSQARDWATQRQINLEISIYDPLKSGLEVLYPNMGADRVAGLEAASRLYPNRDIILFIFGTATTMTVMNAQRQILGGFITTGLGASLRALAACEQLPDLEYLLREQACLQAEQRTSNSLGLNTQDSIYRGTILAHEALIEAWLSQASLLSHDALTIASGAASSHFAAKFDLHLPAAQLLAALS